MLKHGQFPLPRPNAGVWAVPFSLARHEATGEPFLVAAGADVPSVSNDGTLVHVSGVATRATRMAWVDREGKMLHPIGLPQEQWPFPELSPDGRYLLFADFGVDTFWDISYLDLQSGGAAVPLVQGKPNEIAPRISPDARYFAYVSDESGPDEVFLKRFPAGEGHWQVSTGGGAWPRFSRRGDSSTTSPATRSWRSTSRSAPSRSSAHRASCSSARRSAGRCSSAGLPGTTSQPTGTASSSSSRRAS